MKVPVLKAHVYVLVTAAVLITTPVVTYSFTTIEWTTPVYAQTVDTTKPKLPYYNIQDTMPIVKPYSRPNVYNIWLSELMNCQEIILPKEITDSIKFFAVLTNDPAFYINGSGPFAAFTHPWDNKIIIAQYYIFDEKVVKHELTHMLLWHIGNVEDHPQKYFNKKCNTVRFFEGR